MPGLFEIPRTNLVSYAAANPVRTEEDWSYVAQNLCAHFDAPWIEARKPSGVDRVPFLN